MVDAALLPEVRLEEAVHRMRRVGETAVRERVAEKQVAEIVGARSGIGFYIIKSQRYLMVPQIFAAMIIIGVLGMSTDLLMGAAHRWLFPWSAGGARS